MNERAKCHFTTRVYLTDLEINTAVRHKACMAHDETATQTHVFIYPSRARGPNLGLIDWQSSTLPLDLPAP